jgi:hypothetical protein
MEIDLALMADAATVDAAGKLNILGVFDRITAHQFPAPHERMSLVLRFTAGIDEAGDHRLVISLKTPDGAELIPPFDRMLHLGPGPRHLGGEIRFPHILNLNGIVFPAPGQYSFDIQVDDQYLTSLPLYLSQMSGGAMA